LTSEQIVARLLENQALTGQIKEIPREGTLLPETYKFTRGMTREQIIQRMQQAHKHVLQEVWGHRMQDLPVKTPEQLVTLASIVEKETGKDGERSRVAAVFVNRLKNRMRLQSDPTIIYGLVGGKGTLGRGILRSEIEQPTPYNTYVIDAGNSLTVTAAFVSVPPAPSAPQTSAVADNIVHLRAQYGLDDGVAGSVPFAGASLAGDGQVDRFVDANVFNSILPAPPWQSLIAVRLAIVARSALAEKPLGSDGDKCDATTDGTEATPGPDRRPRWSGGLIDVSASGDPVATSPLHWKCYRYRVFETIVPLRNWIWKSS